MEKILAESDLAEISMQSVNEKVAVALPSVNIEDKKVLILDIVSEVSYTFGFSAKSSREVA